MSNESCLLVALIICSSIPQQYHCLSDTQQDLKNASPQLQLAKETGACSTCSTIKPTETPKLNASGGGGGGGLMDIVNVGSRSLEPWLKSIAGLSQVIPGNAQQNGGGPSNPLESMLNIIRPTTTTTTELPMIPKQLLLQAPASVVGVLSGQVAGEPIKELERVGQQTEKVFTKISGIHLTAPPEDETVYYEYGASDQWMDGKRRPRYFSRECNFRMACEVGRMMKPMLGPVANQFKTNKIVQDLQSRYSRAMAYGTLYDNCEKYYCVFLQLLGGPHKFVAATAEIVAQVAAPDTDPI